KYLTLGQAVLSRYFDWATAADDLDSILSDEDIWTGVPDPDNPGNELGSKDLRREIRYFGRIDQVMVTPDDEFWVVKHRIVWDNFLDEDDLLDDPRTLLGQRAFELAYPQMRVAGTVYNEIRIGRDELEGAAPPPDPEPAKCAACLYAVPCKMIDEGLDITEYMGVHFRVRTDEEFNEEGLRYSPHRQVVRASLGGVEERMQNSAKWRGGGAI